jgi:two-component system, cell cycle sensor histidine kinase and response regulator CckA
VIPLFLRPATTVLVVDDQHYSRRVAYRVLSEAGYRVLEAEDGEEALDALYAPRANVDLVIIDVVMPKIDGVELAARIRERWPEKRILFMSGHAAEVLAQHGLIYLDVPFLAKPFTRDEALDKVREALERRQSERTDDPSRRRPP